MNDDRPTPVPPAPGVLTVDGWQTRQLHALWVLVTLLLCAVVAREVWPRRPDALTCPTCPACPACPAPAPCPAPPPCPPCPVVYRPRRAP